VQLPHDTRMMLSDVTMSEADKRSARLLLDTTGAYRAGRLSVSRWGERAGRPVPARAGPVALGRAASTLKRG
jgi:hypothetical protein